MQKHERGSRANGHGGGVGQPASMAPSAVTAVATLEPMLTPEEVAKLLNVSKATLCRLTKRGEIPHKRIGERVVRYSRSAIAAWMKGENP